MSDVYDHRGKPMEPWDPQDEHGPLCRVCGAEATVQDQGSFLEPPGTVRWYCERHGGPEGIAEHNPGFRDLQTPVRTFSSSPHRSSSSELPPDREGGA